MPTYEYACRDCGEHVEVVQSFRDDPLTECGLCAGRLRKVFSAAGIIFKGDGYYVTETRKQAKAAAGSKDSSGAGESGAKDSGAAKGSDASGSGAKGSDASGSGAKGSDASGSGGKGSGSGSSGGSTAAAESA